MACGEDGRGTVVVRHLQRAGKRALNAAEFVRGQRLAVGDRLVTSEPEQVAPMASC